MRPSLSPRPVDAPSSVTLVVPYYENPRMLRRQLACWNSYPKKLQHLPTAVVVDDGSPKFPAAEVVRKKGCAIPVQVFRVREDIPWNVPGARNLGCAQADGWIFMTDIDTLLLAADAREFFESSPLKPRYAYEPSRVRLADSRPMRASVSALLYHKSAFEKIGGYDEDYAGRYGYDDQDFRQRLLRVARLVRRKGVLTRAVSAKDIIDASTIGRPRDRKENRALFAEKKRAGLANPQRPLRFSWERVL